MKTVKNIAKKAAAAGVAAVLLTSGFEAFTAEAAGQKPVVSAAASTIKTGLITTPSGLNVRSGPGTNYARIGGVYKNNTVQIVAQQGEWYKIKFGSGYGYINNLGVQIKTASSEKAVNKTGLITTPSGLNVRSGPGTNYARIGGVYKNNTVQIVAQQGEWYKIKFGSGYGYINNLGVDIIAPPPESGNVSGIVSYAKSWLNRGVTYKMGGTNLVTGGQVDCSYYVQQVFKKNGIVLPRTTWEQVSRGTKVSISQSKPGDLVFFNTYRDSYWNARGNYSSHVGIYLGNNQFINAQSTGGIRIQTLVGNGYWDKVFTQARRIK